MTSPHFAALELALLDAGASTTPSTAIADALGPVATFVNTASSAKPYVDLLLDALPILTGSEQEMVIRALSERGMPKAGPALAGMLTRSAGSDVPSAAWAIGNALDAIRDPATFYEVIDLCRRPDLGASRQMLFHLLPTIGTTEAYEAALAGIHDASVRGHAFEALGRLGRPEALPHIRAVQTQRGLYEAKAQATVIRRLERAGHGAADV